MLVPSMTFEEIRKEMDKDFPIIFRKAGYVSEELEKKLKPKQDELIRRVYDYNSKYKNTWLYAFNMTRKKSIVSFMVYFYGQRGLSGILKMTEGTRLGYFSGHFFQRYNERLNLDLIKPEDKMKAFLPRNINFAIQPLKQVRPGIYKMFTVVDDGVLLGLFDKNLDFYKVNTFITRDMLKGNQLEINAQLEAKLDKYVDSLHELE